MRLVKVPFDKFNSVFTQREFDSRYRLTKRIYIKEDGKGRLSIEEHPSILGYIIFLAVIVVALPLCLIANGVNGIAPVVDEFKLIYVKREPLRKDDLMWNSESTVKLLSVMGLYGYGDK